MGLGKILMRAVVALGLAAAPAVANAFEQLNLR